MNGWAGQILRVYLTEGKIVKEPLSEEMRLKYIGGRGANSKVLFDELKPGIDALGPENIFCVGVGPLNGTAFPASSRWTVSSKSAVNEGLSDGNGGGDFSTELKFAGYDQMIFYGRSPKPVYLYINDKHVELRDASKVWGKGTHQTNALLAQELREPELRVMCIGQAGENQVRVSKIMTNITRAGGKGGVSAVMGSKNLKAIAVRGTGSVKIAKPKEFHQAVKKAYGKIMASPFYNMFRQEGSLFLIKRYHELGSLPTRNLQAGYFEGWEKLTSEAFEKQFAVKHKGCSACPISCAHYFQVKDPKYGVYSESNEYGTTYPLGPKLGIDNLPAILHMQGICDDLGLDTHACGNTVAFAMECWQRGLLTLKDTDGLDLSWGNADAIIKLLPRIAYRQGFGDVLADGSEKSAQKIPGSQICLKTVKGVEVSALFLGKGMNFVQGLGYATATRGADHLRGGVQMYATGSRRLKETLGVEGAAATIKNPRSIEGKGVFLGLDQKISALFNSLNICAWAVGGLFGGLEPDEIAELYSLATGENSSGDDLLTTGERIYNIEKMIQLRAGFRRKDDTLPPNFLKMEETPRGPTGIDKTEFDNMLSQYYEYMGWDYDGIPKAETLVRLGLPDYAAGYRKHA